MGGGCDDKLQTGQASDAERLFIWRNDDITRAMSRSSELVPWASHVEWLDRRLATAEPGLFIAEIDGVPVGTFRIDGDEISYTVAPDYRSRGYAIAMLKLAMDSFGPKRAHIFRRNAASISAARRAGHVVVLLD